MTAYISKYCIIFVLNGEKLCEWYFILQRAVQMVCFELEIIHSSRAFQNYLYSLAIKVRKIKRSETDENLREMLHIYVVYATRANLLSCCVGELCIISSQFAYFTWWGKNVCACSFSHNCHHRTVNE